MKENIRMLSCLLLISMTTFAQKDRIKEAQSLYDKGKSEESLAILNKTEYLILNASNEDKSDYYFLKGNVLINHTKNLAHHRARFLADLMKAEHFYIFNFGLTKRCIFTIG